MALPMYRGPELSQKKSPKYTIAVAAGKGGVGKSTIALNLALALAAGGGRVGVLDADIYGPSIRHMLPEDRLPGQEGEKLIPALAQGISTISMAYFRRPEEAAAVRAPIANGVIKQFLSQVEWGDLDYLIIDFPPGTGDVQLTLAQQAHLTAAVLVTTPQELALLDVRKAADLFQRVSVPILGVVENMSYYMPDSVDSAPLYPFGKGGGRRLTQEFGVPLLGQIPLNPIYAEAADRGNPLSASAEESLPFVQLAESVKQHIEGLIESADTALNNFELQW